MRTKGFTLIELLVAIAIIGVLSSIVVVSLNESRKRAYFSRALAETRNIAVALEFYFDKNDAYPLDTPRNIDPGLGPYLSSGWPQGPWPGSIYDWDNWNDPSVPGQKIHQVSIRFCPPSGPISACNFPDEPWAAGFDIDSAAYYCVAGACRSHISHPVTYPGFCLNC
ncbi:MAG: hypothetical protein A2653_00340 [Candidatus Zambryskibacteria bacterium RIFCSPHIGHO2_01_FULL_43_25]|uniref:Type II secretion system protein GspG C-terminal domain-containing protein n=1 Tax=Candidatus Zambryskibacteria bacterium RIFCSPLOWO2_01_FULL_45_21 TaxID=1802761 RepID=A0A1G2U4S6_9BACT|nr:MAG: hypothetical protein A2653_00340 [Candidatus Zambryskibacteria bacterium RIFCSPHIGHO2_01_FULL_43_25]OHB00677.1 MAG: hypothetical protein A3E94_03595 [Candidatus Zambryskibacteria bacterium RIFCSPHIGHO2_12_FULL_44_12b]OHB04493.1 MAG: hypothetical protein A3B14_03635 [Candidatus Zambryskibacteria bacterium RIFCSPLOWO2_01_FULL_45_21]